MVYHEHYTNKVEIVYNIIPYYTIVYNTIPTLLVLTHPVYDSKTRPGSDDFARLGRGLRGFAAGPVGGTAKGAVVGSGTWRGCREGGEAAEPRIHWRQLKQNITSIQWRRLCVHLYLNQT